MSVRSEYFKEWYAKNAAQLNARRRKRYHSDPEYRRQCIDQALRYKAKAVRKPRTKVLISEAATQIGKSPWTLRYWERQGLVPTALSETNTRYYTENQIELLQLLSEQMDRIRDNRKSTSLRDELEGMRVYIAEHWDDD